MVLEKNIGLGAKIFKYLNVRKNLTFRRMKEQTKMHRTRRQLPERLRKGQNMPSKQQQQLGKENQRPVNNVEQHIPTTTTNNNTKPNNHEHPYDLKQFHNNLQLIQNLDTFQSQQHQQPLYTNPIDHDTILSLSRISADVDDGCDSDLDLSIPSPLFTRKNKSVLRKSSIHVTMIEPRESMGSDWSSLIEHSEIHPQSEDEDADMNCPEFALDVELKAASIPIVSLEEEFKNVVAQPVIPVITPTTSQMTAMNNNDELVAMKKKMANLESQLKTVESERDIWKKKYFDLLLNGKNMCK